MAKREHETIKPQPSRVGKKSVTVYLPENTWRDLKILAATTDSTIDALNRHHPSNGPPQRTIESAAGEWANYNRKVALQLIGVAIKEAIAARFVRPRTCGRCT